MFVKQDVDFSSLEMISLLGVAVFENAQTTNMLLNLTWC